MSGLSVTGFDDVSHSIESMTSDMINSSSLAIANSMIQSNIQSIHLTQASEADTYHTIDYTVGTERVVGACQSPAIQSCSNCFS